MLCPHCHSVVADAITQCPFCGNALVRPRRFTVGKISLFFAFSGLIGSLFLLVLIRIFMNSALDFAIFFINVLLILSVLSIISGGYAYLHPSRDILGLISVILGILLLAGLIIGSSLALSFSAMPISMNKEILIYLL